MNGFPNFLGLQYTPEKELPMTHGIDRVPQGEEEASTEESEEGESSEDADSKDSKDEEISA